MEKRKYQRSSNCMCVAHTHNNIEFVEKFNEEFPFYHGANNVWSKKFSMHAQNGSYDVSLIGAKCE